MHHQEHFIIALLAIYVIFDFLISVIVYKKNPSVWDAVKNDLSRRDVLLSLAVAIAAGVALYYLLCYGMEA